MSIKWNSVDFLFGQLWFGATIKNQNMYMHIIVHLSMGSRAPHFSIYFYGVIFLLLTPSLSIFQCFQNGYASNTALTLLFPLTMTAIGPSVFFNFLFLSISLVSPAFCGYMCVWRWMYHGFWYLVLGRFLLAKYHNKCDDFYDYEILHLNNVRYIAAETFIRKMAPKQYY